MREQITDADRYDAFLEADHAASVAHDFIWGRNGVTKDQASDAIHVVHAVLRPYIVLDGDDVAGNLEGELLDITDTALRNYLKAGPGVDE